VLLRVRTETLWVAGVDVGETEIKAALFDGSLDRQAMSTRPTRGNLDPEHVAGLVVDAVAEVSGGGPPLLGIGVGVPGAVDERRGLVYAPTLGWDATPFARLVATGTNSVVHLENVARALGQAELWFGAARGAARAIVALVGVGVGAALMTDGTHPRGGSGLTSEWGHTVVQIGGRRCRCGSRGCLEAYVGAEAVLARYKDEPGSTRLPGRGLAARLSALLDRAVDEDAARTVLAETAEVLGVGVANLINLLAPERVVIAGWAGMSMGPAILPTCGRWPNGTRWRTRSPECRSGWGSWG